MATFEEYVEERRAARKAMAQARATGTEEEIRTSERLAGEWEWLVEHLIRTNMDRILEVAGEIDMGPIPFGFERTSTKAGAEIDADALAGSHTP